MSLHILLEKWEGWHYSQCLCFFDKYLLIALQALWVYQQSEAVFLVVCDNSMTEL